MNGSRDKRRKADPVIASSTDWRPKARHANAKNVVRICYEHETGRVSPAYDIGSHPGEWRAYLDWCEVKANKWLKLLDEFGYKGWSSEIRTLTGSIDYWDWLKKEVGL